MAARGNVLYACHLWKISTYDVTSIEPYGLGQANFGISHDLILEPHGVRDLTISGNLAYVLTQMDAFSIIDISNQNPDKTLWILKDDGASISVAGNRIVTAVGADGLHIYELGADGWPTFVGRVDTFSHGGFMATGVLTDGIYAYATEDGTEMQVYRKHRQDCVIGEKWQHSKKLAQKTSRRSGRFSNRLLTFSNRASALLALCHQFFGLHS
jgi:hypothetical protein